MYLNTMPFGFNAFGVEAAAQVYFSQARRRRSSCPRPRCSWRCSRARRATTRAQPGASPSSAATSCCTRMAEDGVLAEGAGLPGAAHSTSGFNTPDPHESPAPYFADFVARWVQAWCADHGCDLYRDGLKIYTTLDTRVQSVAEEAVLPEADGLQAVADYEWSRAGAARSGSAGRTRRTTRSVRLLLAHPHARGRRLLRATDRFKRARGERHAPRRGAPRLRADAAVHGLAPRRPARASKWASWPSSPRPATCARGSAGATTRHDRVRPRGQARRQPGSTFKAFVYTAAIDWGHAPGRPLPRRGHARTAPGPTRGRPPTRAAAPRAPA